MEQMGEILDILAVGSFGESSADEHPDNEYEDEEEEEEEEKPITKHNKLIEGRLIIYGMPKEEDIGMSVCLYRSFSLSFGSFCSSFFHVTYTMLNSK